MHIGIIKPTLTPNVPGYCYVTSGKSPKTVLTFLYK